jgi:hypothetical protein
MQYPSESELEACLRTVAVEAGDMSGAPFRISIVRLHGKPPMYSVVILSASKEPMRQRLGKILSRNFSLGVTSIFLTVAEVESLMAHCQTVRQETKA